jgi:sortase A
MRRKLSVAVIIIGITVMLYPFLEQGFTRYWQQRLLSDWESKAVIQGYDEIDQLLQMDLEYDDEEDEVENRAPLTPRGEMLGVLLIDSINLRLPIISGLNETNLKIGISYLEETPKFGEYGNTVLAGHRGHSYGRLLNRLNEVKIGDIIVISTNEGDFKYKAYNIVIVKPEEIQVLYTDKKEKILSIVTCEPVYKPTLRLIVQGKLEP